MVHRPLALLVPLLTVALSVVASPAVLARRSVDPGSVLQNSLDPAERAGAALDLGDRGPGAVQLLIRALDDPSAEVREAVVEALAMVGDARCVHALSRLVATDPSERVRSRALQVIAFFGSMLGYEARLVETLRADLPPDPVAAARDAGEAALPPARPPAAAIAAPPLPDPPATRTPGPPGAILAARPELQATSASDVVVRSDLVVSGGAPDARHQIERRLSVSIGRLPGVRLATAVLDGPTAAAGAPCPSCSRGESWIVDGKVDLWMSSGGDRGLECHVDGVLATYPERAIKATLSSSVLVPWATGIDDPAALAQCYDFLADEVSSYVDQFLRSRQPRPRS